MKRNLRTTKNQGKSLLITGCSTGIGLHCATAMLERGWRVFGTARTDEDLAALANIGVDPIYMEMWDLASIDRGLQEVLQKTEGCLDGLFNNAAYGLNGGLEDIPTGSLRAQLECNVLAWHHLTSAVIPLMRKQKHGRIVMNSSILGFVAIPWRGPYSMSKYAIEGMVDTLRLELAGSGVYVSSIQPGPITSKFRENAYRIFQNSGIDTKRSALSKTYVDLIARFRSESTGDDKFELGPESVAKRLIHALESKRPRIRYPVTFPTYLFGWLKRILTDRALDRILRRV